MMATNDTACTLRFGWGEIGNVLLDGSGKLRFPDLPTKPGLYEFRVRGPKGDAGRYVGETDNLQRRFAHYRNPGPTQPTNLRLNALVKEVLGQGGNVEPAIVIDNAWIIRNGQEELADLTNKNVRRLFENAALITGQSRDVLDLNK
jgi:hypothetical protein